MECLVGGGQWPAVTAGWGNCGDPSGERLDPPCLRNSKQKLMLASFSGILLSLSLVFCNLPAPLVPPEDPSLWATSWLGDRSPASPALSPCSSQNSPAPIRDEKLEKGLITPAPSTMGPLTISGLQIYYQVCQLLLNLSHTTNAFRCKDAPGHLWNILTSKSIHCLSEMQI